MAQETLEVYFESEVLFISEVPDLSRTHWQFTVQGKQLKTMPCVSITLLKVIYLVYTCSEAYIEQVTFYSTAMLNWSPCTTGVYTLLGPYSLCPKKQRLRY